MTAPDARPSGFDGNARGLAVLVAALLVGFLLLLNAGDGGETASSGDTTTSTIDLGGVEAPDDTSPDGTADTTTSTEPEATGRPPAEVQVIVLNGSGVTGAASATSATIGQSGYQMLTEGNGPTTEVTTVYFADGYEIEATSVALVLGKSPDVVTPLSEASLGGAEGAANVVVVLGADTPPVGDATTDTTDATGTGT